jgi:hypothetical protein
MMRSTGCEAIAMPGAVMRARAVEKPRIFIIASKVTIGLVVAQPDDG